MCVAVRRGLTCTEVRCDDTDDVEMLCVDVLCDHRLHFALLSFTALHSMVLKPENMPIS